MITGTSFNLRRLFAEQRYSVLVTFDLITRHKYQRAQSPYRKALRNISVTDSENLG